MKKVEFKFDKMVSEWSGKEGASVNSWHMDVSGMNTEKYLDESDELQEVLKNVLSDYYLPTDYFIIMDDGRISFNCIEDGDSNYIKSSEEQNRLEKEGEQLYLCDYSVFIEIMEVYEPSMEQLKELFPSAEY